MTKTISAAQFASALEAMPQPKGKQIPFLKAHYDAPRRAATATVLANAVGYKGFGGINLWYGKLAAGLGALLGHRNAHISLLVDFIRPTVTNKHWTLVMKPEFAEGLKRAHWI